MKVEHLASKIKNLQPHWHSSDIAEMCLMLSVSDDIETFENDSELSNKCSTLHLKRQHVTEQYGAVLEELNELADSDPTKFGREQVWSLLRAIKIQDQIIKLHLGGDPLDV
ncbi:MAG: hypothetical protein AAGF97_09580 [Planctomycetota bacterium]